MKRTVKVLLCGFYGCGNLGDDAILLSLLRTLPVLLPEVRILVLFGNDRAGKRLLEKEGAVFGNIRGEVRLVDRKSFSALRAIRESDAVVLGGGSLLQNTTGQASLYYYLSLLRYAQICGKKTALLAGGYGTVRGAVAKKAVREVLSSVDYLSFRDEKSKKTVEQLLRDPSRKVFIKEDLHLSADPAILLLPRFMKGKTPYSPYRYFLVSPRRRTAASLSRFVQKIVSLAVKYEASPLIVDLFPGEDGAICREIYEKLLDFLGTAPYPPRLLPQLSVSELLLLVRECEFVLTMRYHLALFAFSQSVPFYALGSDPKLVGISHEKNPKEARRRAEEDLRRFSAFLSK